MKDEQRLIPNLVCYGTEEVACLHEAGHAVAAVLAGAKVVEIVLYPDPHRPYGRTRVERNDFQRPKIAIGGFAVERRLWEDKRLVDPESNPLTEKAMLDAASRNADEDRLAYFGGDYRKPNGYWPKEMDLQFMMQGRALGQRLDMYQVERLATALLNERKLDHARVAALIGEAD